MITTHYKVSLNHRAHNAIFMVSFFSIHVIYYTCVRRNGEE